MNKFEHVDLLQAAAFGVEPLKSYLMAVATSGDGTALRRYLLIANHGADGEPSDVAQVWRY